MMVADSSPSGSSSPPIAAGSTTAMPPTIVFGYCAGAPAAGRGPPAPDWKPSDGADISMVPLNLGAGFEALLPAERGALQRWQAAAPSGF
ncbi:MAG: hypothetical protein U0324_23900 [Polyangiales bacterium]